MEGQISRYMYRQKDRQIYNINIFKRIDSRYMFKQIYIMYVRTQIDRKINDREMSTYTARQLDIDRYEKDDYLNLEILINRLLNQIIKRFRDDVLNLIFYYYKEYYFQLQISNFNKFIILLFIISIIRISPQVYN